MLLSSPQEQHQEPHAEEPRRRLPARRAQELHGEDRDTRICLREEGEEGTVNEGKEQKENMNAAFLVHAHKSKN